MRLEPGFHRPGSQYMVREVFDFGSSARLSFAIIIIINRSLTHRRARWSTSELDEAPQQVSEGLCVHLLTGRLGLDWCRWWVLSLHSICIWEWPAESGGATISFILPHSETLLYFLSLTVKINSECLARCVTDGFSPAFSWDGAVVLRASVNRLSGWCLVAGSLGVSLTEDQHQGLRRPLGGAGRRPTPSRAVMSHKPQQQRPILIIIIILIYMQIRQKMKLKQNNVE